MGLRKYIIKKDDEEKILHWKMYEFIPLNKLFEDDIHYETHKYVYAEQVSSNIFKLRNIKTRVVQIYCCDLGEEGCGNRRYRNYIFAIS